jgi:ribosomal protein L24E
MTTAEAQVCFQKIEKKVKRRRNLKAIIMVETAKEPLVNVKSGHQRIVVKADATRGRKAMKKAMRNFKQERVSRRPAWPGLNNE